MGVPFLICHLFLSNSSAPSSYPRFCFFLHALSVHVYVTGKGARRVAPMRQTYTFTLDNGQIDSNTLLSHIIVLLITLGV